MRIGIVLIAIAMMVAPRLAMAGQTADPIPAGVLEESQKTSPPTSSSTFHAKFFLEDALNRSCVERRQLIDGGHGGVFEPLHSASPQLGWMSRCVSTFEADLDQIASDWPRIAFLARREPRCAVPTIPVVWLVPPN